MDITVADIINLCNFTGMMKLIAGEEGLNRIVTKCGILDYEYDSSIKNKYLYKNFQEGQFVLTSFLYAKDNEYLIIDALKNLINRKTNGLAIKNIFQIPLHDAFLRYADSKKFPVFLIEDQKLYFEDIIVKVSESISSLSSVDFGATEVDVILNGSLDDSAIVQHAMRINHSFRPDLLAVYFRPKRTYSIEDYAKLVSQYKNSSVYSSSDSLFRYRNGLMLIHTQETFHTRNISELMIKNINIITEDPNNFFIGVSDLHHSLPELRDALRECIYASVMHQSSNQTYQLYKELGVYKILLPFIDDPQVRTFSSQIIESLLDYDAENKTKLMDTAVQLVLCDGNLHKLAQTLLQHENTIRYRLDKIRSITGLDIRKPEQYEQLSIAIKIHNCRNLFHEFHYDIY